MAICTSRPSAQAKRSEHPPPPQISLLAAESARLWRRWQARSGRVFEMATAHHEDVWRQIGLCPEGDRSLG